jgi:hypothetical protein
LPLAGVSFSALVAIPTVTFLLATYNKQVTILRDWAALKIAVIPAPVISGFVERLHPIALPSLTFWLLISTIFLAVASTLFTGACPDRIKEFSLKQWEDELRQPASQYLSLAWSRRWARVPAAICYLLGTAGTGLIFLVKLWNAGRFIITNTELPWWAW